MNRYCALIYLLALVPALLLAGETHDVVAGKPTLDILDADKELPLSRIVPTLDADHERGKNLLYCATLQLAWNECMGLLEGPLELEGNPAAAVKLNKKEFTREMLDAESYLAFAGKGPGAPKQLADALKAKFGGDASPKLTPDTLALDQFITYSYLYKNLAFVTPVYAYPEGFAFARANVKTFGIPPHADGRHSMLQSVRVHDHVNADNFVVELVGNPAERLLIAKIAPGKTLQASVESVLKRLNKTNRNTLEDEEDLRVPCYNFELVKTYSDLAPRKLFHKDWANPGELKECVQLVRLKLDERGAILKSEAKLRLRPGEVGIDDEPPQRPPLRHFICDKPFLVVMLRANQTNPYLALWVDNAEFLVKSDAPLVQPAVDPKAPALRRGRPGSANIDD